MCQGTVAFLIYFLRASNKSCRADKGHLVLFIEFTDNSRNIKPFNQQVLYRRIVARVESLRGRMAESTRQVEGLFESLSQEAFDG